jgi:hypothetical protein
VLMTVFFFRGLFPYVWFPWDMKNYFKVFSMGESVRNTGLLISLSIMNERLHTYTPTGKIFTHPKDQNFSLGAESSSA